MAAKLHSAQMIQNNAGKQFFHMQKQQENIREGNFYFPNCSISISLSSVDRISKLEPIGKITLYVISQS